MTIALDAVLDAELLDAADAITSLRAHCGPAATVVVFLRHYG